MPQVESKDTDRARTHGSAPGDRGRSAESPTDVPAPGWKDILIRTKDEVARDNLSIVAAGVAFYCFVAFVPALGATVSVYALVNDPASVQEHLAVLARVIPGEAMPLIEEQVQRLTSAESAAGVGALVSFAIALFGSSAAVKALIQGLNVAYDEDEKRGFFKLQILGVVLALGAVVGAVVALALLAVAPSLAEWMHLPEGAQTLINWLRWPLLAGAFMTTLAVLYRFGPSRDAPQWKWLSWGAAFATGLWIAGSALFSLYVSTLGNYEKTYGSLGALVVFLFWLFISAFAVLIGAELNSEMERQTKKDTTEGPEKPMGKRGAYSADTVGEAKG